MQCEGLGGKQERIFMMTNQEKTHTILSFHAYVFKIR